MVGVVLFNSMIDTNKIDCVVIRRVFVNEFDGVSLAASLAVCCFLAFFFGGFVDDMDLFLLCFLPGSAVPCAFLFSLVCSSLHIQ